MSSSKRNQRFFIINGGNDFQGVCILLTQPLRTMSHSAISDHEIKSLNGLFFLLNIYIYNPQKFKGWPFIRPFIRVITPFIIGRGPPCINP